MATRSALKSSTSPFAHLARPPKAAESDDDKKKDDAKKAKADGDDDKSDDDDKKAKGKKAKAEDEDDSEMEDEEDDKDARAARARERSRIRAILVSEPGIANPVAAAHLATGTAMPRGQAIEMLAAMQALSTTMHVEQPGAAAAEPRRDNLRDRMAEVPNPVVGAEGTRTAPSMAEQIVLAGKKRRGEV